jgi:hypothetical protein
MHVSNKIRTNKINNDEKSDESLKNQDIKSISNKPPSN